MIRGQQNFSVKNPCHKSVKTTAKGLINIHTGLLALMGVFASQNVSAADCMVGSTPESMGYVANLAAANNMFINTIHDRAGETQYIDVLTGEQRVTTMWLRGEGAHNRSRNSCGDLRTHANSYVVQLGGDLVQWSSTGLDRFHMGVMGGYGNSKSKTVPSVDDNGRASVDGYSAGLYGSWYANEVNDKPTMYVDVWAQYSWFDNTVSAGQGVADEEYKSKGLTASFELGYVFKLGANVDNNVAYFIQPKAQVIWKGVKADDHRLADGTKVTGEGDGDQVRVGLRFFANGYSEMDKGKNRVFQPFIEANWIHNTKDFAANIGTTSVEQDGARNIGELKIGVEGQATQHVNLWGNVAQQVGNKGYSDTSAMLGLRVNF